MEIIDCAKIREEMLREARERITEIGGLNAVIVRVVGDPASRIYVKQKVKTAESIGINIEVVECPSNISRSKLQRILAFHNWRKNVVAVMLQLPLPEHLKPYQQELLDTISWYKDIDGLSTVSVGRLWSNLPCITPATPTGILRLLPSDLSGQNVVIVSRSALVGKPLAKLLLDRNATPTICHSKTDCLDSHFYTADYVVVGIGIPKHIDFMYGVIDMEPKLWIDVGINRLPDGLLCGDLDLEDFKRSDHTITPVPGGVGVLTTAQLMLNIIKAYDLQRGL